ncbi:MAG: ABC transporter permease subunit, partial [Tenericutes bacterium]|nr:ABC transporter permease subunit [Mycoplasmatota bacterium]
IYSALLGSRIISKEEQKRTAEYLFTLPVSRTKVITSKLVVAITYSIIIDILSMLVCLYSFGRFAESPDTFATFVFNLGVGVLFTQIIFLSIGLLLSSLLKNYKKSGGITVGFVIGTFMLSMLVGLAQEAEFLKYFTPFQYFPAAEMINGEYDLIFILISVGIVAASISGFYFFYKKRDLHI